MGEASGNGGLFGILIILVLAVAWIYFEPFSKSYTGYYKTCHSDEMISEPTFGGSFLRCTTPTKKWNEVTTIKFTPNINTRTVIYKMGSSIRELRNCTILDRKNFRCPLENRESYNVSMKNGKLIGFGGDFSYQVLTKIEAWKLKYENRINND